MTIDLKHLTENREEHRPAKSHHYVRCDRYLMVSSTIKPHTAPILVTVNELCKVILGVIQSDGVVVPPGSLPTQP
jgi:hypothetical protein